MLPFSETLRLWRLERGLTQETLARRVRIPRPNLSAIERGRREVSLPTLRALACGLNLRPGILADGIAPGEALEPVALSRVALERIAEAVVHNRKAPNRAEQTVVDLLRQVITHRTQAAQPWQRRGRGSGRRCDTAWTRLQARCGPEAVRSLIQRIDDRLRFA